MVNRPIIFSTDMVRAILDGRKTQTRRVIMPQPPAGFNICACDASGRAAWSDEGGELGNWFPRDDSMPCRYGHPGDTLWVREAWRCDGHGEAGQFVFRYRADNVTNGIALTCKYDNGDKWRPSIHMPRIASRLTLEVVKVRVERLQGISEDDVLAEGLPPCLDCDEQMLRHRDGEEHGRIQDFRVLWDSINAKRGYGWDADPFVWVVEFRRLERDANEEAK